MTFRLYSDTLEDGGKLPDAQVHDQMGYSGGNRSPALRWEGAPEGTRSFVVTMYDPDAPTGSGWWHWVVINLPAEVTSLAEGAGSAGGSLPEGAINTRTDFGSAGYGGAAPPEGETHRYIVTVHALKVDRLDLDADSGGAMVGFNVHFNSLASASLTVFYV